MLVVIVIFPRQGMMATFDRANHLFFILPVANNCLFVVVFSQLVGLVPA